MKVFGRLHYVCGPPTTLRRNTSALAGERLLVVQEEPPDPLSVLERDGDAAAIGKDRGPGAALGTAFLDNATSILWLGSPAI